MTFPSLLLLLAFFASQGGKSISSGAIDQRAVSKDCAVNIANVTGDVTVQCPGIPANALWPLNRELTARRLSEAEARRSAEEWRQKYESLQATMASAALPGALLTQALSDLDRGDLAEASKVLDEAIKQQDPGVMQAASIHYYRSKVAELQFDRDTEREQLGKAYSLAPHAIMIANEYGIFLSKYGALSESDKVFSQLLKEARAANALALQAATLINDAGTLRMQGRFTEAMQDYLEAASLWEACFRNQEPNSLNNQAAALSGAATVAFSELHFEEGKALITKSITLYRSTLKQEPPSSAQQIRLSLARALLTAAGLYLATGDYSSAFSACEEAYKIGAETADANLTNKAKGVMGDALASECYVSALTHSPQIAQNYCDRALAARGVSN